MSSKTLACFGCSHTDLDYTCNLIGDRPDLMSPHPEWKWPTLLAKKLDMDLIAYAKCGAGPDVVFKNAIKCISKDNPDVLAIYWPELVRRSIYGYQYNPNTHSDDIHHAKFQNSHSAYKLGTYLRKILEEENTYFECSVYNEWFDSIEIIENLCEKNNIKLMMFCADSPDVLERLSKKETQEKQLILDRLMGINEDHWIGWPMFNCLGGKSGQMELVPERYTGERDKLYNDSRRWKPGNRMGLEGRMDAHFGQIGHAVLAEVWYEKYQEISKKN